MTMGFSPGIPHLAFPRVRDVLSHRPARPRSLVTVCLLLASGSGVPADDWPQWMGPERDGVWRESGIVERIPEGALPKVRWRAPVKAGYTGPAVAGGRVYVMDFQRNTGVDQPSNAFAQGSIPGTERVVCLDERDGKELWAHAYPSVYTVSYAGGPRVTPAVSGGKVYSVGAEGHLFCLDAATGRVVWGRHFGKDYGVKTPMWGFAGHPLVHGNTVICLVGGEGSVAVAFDLNTGQEQWRALSAKEPGYCPPTLLRVDDREQLVIWHPESVNGLDPDTGRVLWSEPWAIRSGLSVPTPRLQGDRLFLTSFYNGSTLFRFESGSGRPSKVWQTEKASERDTTHLHSIMSTPAIVDGTVYGVCSYGQFRALNLEDGRRLWESMEFTTNDGKPERWANAFLVRHEDRHFVFNELGDLILVRLRPGGPEVLGRHHLLDPTNTDVRSRKVLWSHPAFANRSVYARNDEELVCVSLAAEPQ